MTHRLPPTGSTNEVMTKKIRKKNKANHGLTKVCNLVIYHFTIKQYN